MRLNLIAVFLLVLIAGTCVNAADTTLLVKGHWGKEVNQIGIRLPAPGVMPVAPFECLGGYDIDEKGNLWLTDSVNRMLKRYKNKDWFYLMTSFEKMGDISSYNQRLYVVTRNPDGVAVINPENGKVEQQLRIDFRNPGRLKVFAPAVIGVEEPGVGLWICRNGKADLHPATALEAVGDSKTLYGMQYNFDTESRTIISAELAEQPQEPETIALFEAGSNIVYSKMAGLLNNRPMFMVVTASNPGVLSFYTLDEQQPTKKVELPIFEAPFLTSNWKLCSDGNLYGFEGTASEGFKIHRYNGKM